jgi:hypothetical protein
MRRPDYYRWKRWDELWSTESLEQASYLGVGDRTPLAETVQYPSGVFVYARV